jgi:hypothetical protein
MKHLTQIFIILAVLVLFGCNSSTPKSNDKPSADAVATDPKPPNAQTANHPDINKLIGEWMRADGGKSIRINSAAPDGKLDAAYFNPNPIRVGRAAWLVKDNILVVVVELRDVNYPGSTYTLQYFPDGDILSGNYFQAVENANYEVQFSRQK